MTRQRYVPEDNKWLSYGPFDGPGLAEAVYQEVGATFPLTFDGNRVMFDPDDLPDGVTENDVKQAVRDNHPHR